MPEFDDDVMCYECEEGYFLNYYGECIQCKNNQVKNSNDECIYCEDVEYGGIEGCAKCENENDNIICNECKDGFILYENNKTCLRISKNKELIEFISCKSLILNESNNKLTCNKCLNGFSLLLEKSKSKCVSFDFIENPYKEYNKNCLSFINLNTEDIPNYFCNKCISNDMTLYTFNNSLTSFCGNKSLYDLGNCLEATIMINGTLATCTKCAENTYIYHHKYANIDTCVIEVKQPSRCAIKFCYKCKEGNNYFCEKCLMEDYESNPITGACVKKTKKIPEINWKDLFRLQFNQNKIINGGDVYGISLVMRGITQSEINTGQAFLINLIYDIKYMRTFRFLEEEKKIPTICEIIDSVDESDEPNIVEFGCITNLTKYENNEIMKDNIMIKNIEVNEDNYNLGLLKNDNLKELMEETDMSNLNKKSKSNFTLNNYLNIATFFPNDIKNLNFENNITIDGKLNKKLELDTIKTELNLAQNNKRVDCLFSIKKDSKAELNCEFNDNLKETNNIFNFKSKTIDRNNSIIYLGNISEINLIHISNDINPKSTEKNDGEEDKENNKKKDEKMKIIFIFVTFIVIIIIVIVVIIIRCKKTFRIQPEEANNRKRDNNLDKYIVTYSETRAKLKRYNPNK